MSIYNAIEQIDGCFVMFSYLSFSFICLRYFCICFEYDKKEEIVKRTRKRNISKDLLALRFVATMGISHLSPIQGNIMFSRF